MTQRDDMEVDLGMLGRELFMLTDVPAVVSC